MTWGDVGDSLVEFIAKEKPAELTVEEVVYRNVASYGRVAERMTCGHKEMRWLDREGRRCVALFTPRCSGYTRRRR